MTRAEQVRYWVEGISIHNVEHDECCPDFSCCTVAPVAALIRRQFEEAFLCGDTETVDLWLLMFLVRMLEEAQEQGALDAVLLTREADA